MVTISDLVVEMLEQAAARRAYGLPWNLHLSNGLFDADRSRVSVLAITAHVPASETGSTDFQETHPEEPM